jgi:hypothetical protein
MFNQYLHEHLVTCGFELEGGRYYARHEPSWERKRYVEAGLKQGAWPSSTVEEYEQHKKSWIERKLKMIEELKAAAPA